MATGPNRFCHGVCFATRSDTHLLNVAIHDQITAHVSMDVEGIEKCPKSNRHLLHLDLMRLTNLAQEQNASGEHEVPREPQEAL